VVQAASGLIGDQSAVLERILKSDHINEAVIVSTCQRLEIYVDALRFHGAVSDLRATFADLLAMPIDEVADLVVERHDEGACAHLFSLAAGAQSAVLGEGEILGQLSRAWAMAREAGSCKSILNGLFRHAVVTGKRARNETAIAHGVTSTAGAALALLDSHSGGIAGKSVLIVGAGDIASSAVATIARYNPAVVTIANRNPDRAVAMANSVGAQVIDLEALPNALASHDVVLCATAAPGAISTIEQLARAGRTVVADLAVPPDLPPEASELDGVTVIDLQEVEGFASSNRSDRTAELELVSEIVAEEVHRFLVDSNTRLMSPVITELREHLEGIRQSELQRSASKLAQLSESDRQIVAALSKAMMAKVLHCPSVALKAAAGTTDGERLADAVRKLFEV